MPQFVHHDPQLGTIHIRTLSTARRFSFTIRNGAVHVVMPLYARREQLLEAIEHTRPALTAALQQAEPSLLKAGYRRTFAEGVLEIAEGDTLQTQMLHPRPGHYTLAVPRGTQFTEAVRAQISKVFERILCSHAKVLLARRLAELSERHALPFNRLTVRATHKQWGCCTTGKNISLSCYLLFLPPHLADYVMLHELAHTREMNHSSRFWELLDRLTGHRAHALRNELRQHKPCL